MFKRKTKQIVAICLMAIIVLCSSISLANSEIPTDEANATTSNQEILNQLMQMKINRGDRYVLNDTVVVNELIDGNLFAMGKDVTISSEIAGDIFVFGNTVTIDATVYQNAYIFANEIIINGLVNDLYACSSSLVINENGSVYRDLNATNSDTTILGTVGRNAYLSVNSLSLGNEEKHGNIAGNLTYTAPQSMVAPEGSILGTTNYTQIEEEPTLSMQEYLVSQAINVTEGVIVVIAIWLVSLLVGKEFNKKSSVLVSRKLLPTIGIGILSLIGIPAACVLIMLIPGLTRVGLLGLGLYVLMLIIAVSIACIGIGNYFAKKCKKPTWYKTLFSILLVSYLVIILKNLPIPYLASFVSFIFVVIGLGILVSNFFYKGDKKETKEVTQAKKQEAMTTAEEVKESKKEEPKQVNTSEKRETKPATKKTATKAKTETASKPKTSSKTSQAKKKTTAKTNTKSSTKPATKTTKKEEK